MTHLRNVDQTPNDLTPNNRKKNYIHETNGFKAHKTRLCASQSPITKFPTASPLNTGMESMKSSLWMEITRIATPEDE